MIVKDVLILLMNAINVKLMLIEIHYKQIKLVLGNIYIIIIINLIKILQIYNSVISISGYNDISINISIEQVKCCHRMCL